MFDVQNCWIWLMPTLRSINLELGVSLPRDRSGTPRRSFCCSVTSPANQIKRWSPESGIISFRTPSGRSNGLTYDKQGRLIACEHENRRVSRTEADGTIIPIATHYNGKRLNSPNDVVVKSDGSIYFSDPPYGIMTDNREITGQELDFSRRLPTFCGWSDTDASRQ